MGRPGWYYIAVWVPRDVRDYVLELAAQHSTSAAEIGRTCLAHGIPLIVNGKLRIGDQAHESDDDDSND